VRGDELLGQGGLGGRTVVLRPHFEPQRDAFDAGPHPGPPEGDSARRSSRAASGRSRTRSTAASRRSSGWSRAGALSLLRRDRVTATPTRSSSARNIRTASGLIPYSEIEALWQPAGHLMLELEISRADELFADGANLEAKSRYSEAPPSIRRPSTWTRAFTRRAWVSATACIPAQARRGPGGIQARARGQLRRSARVQ